MRNEETTEEMKIIQLEMLDADIKQQEHTLKYLRFERTRFNWDTLNAECLTDAIHTVRNQLVVLYKQHRLQGTGKIVLPYTE
jgi:hypothetical protein